MTSKRRIIVTNALPYANGPLHLGHALGYIQTDIWARFQRMCGHDCYYICGSDTHGTPIMIKAREQGLDPAEMTEARRQEHLKDFNDLGIVFDSFYTTHSEENQTLVNTLYHKIKAKGDIDVHSIEQAFDEQENLFLPDRFIKGTCPKCKAPDQYGDNCEVCGATYDPIDLIDPVSAISGTRPIRKKSEHYFFQLSHYTEALKTWFEQANLQPEIKHKLQEWFEDGLKDWDISRDAPYFGFEIPDAPGKYFYVWLDAPIGYLASFMHFCQQNPNVDFDEFWDSHSQTELYHFIGKDITYFHALFWPAMLMSADIHTPNGIFVNGFLTINGQKMSKSRGTFITAREYLDQYDAEYLRYYYAAKLSDSVEDIDLNWQDFSVRVNSDLVGKVINIASRCAGFIRKQFDNRLSSQLIDADLQQTLSQAADSIYDLYQNRQFNKAVREIMALADLINQFIDQHQPWVLAKEHPGDTRIQDICTQGINGFRMLMIYLKPILPTLAAKTEVFLNIPELTWADHKQPLLDHTINKFKPMLQRVELKETTTTS